MTTLLSRGAATACTALFLALPGCGGDSPPAQGTTQLDYTPPADTRYSYAPYASPSDIAGFAGQTYVGGDVEPQQGLRLLQTFRDGTRFYMGAVRDGAGVDRLANYERDLRTQDGADPYELDDKGFYPFRVAPRLFVNDYFLEDQNADIFAALMDSVRILNDALPPEFQIQLGGVRESYGGYYTAYGGEIMAILDSRAGVMDNCGVTAAACADGQTLGGYMHQAFVRIPDDFDVTDYRYARSTIIHELLHALGVWGHVDSVEFPDSVMGASGGYIPNLTHSLNKIDREVLQIMYMSQESDTYNDWGEWSDVSHHLAARTEDGSLNFGVALFNGLPQPWVRGTTPDMALADNRRLRGTATWSGHFVGFSGPSPLLGGAELQVRLATLADPDNEQDLRFRDIFFVNRFESASADRWFPTRNIDYKVNVYGDNLFRNVRAAGYEEGWVTGVFLGAEHEHMGGTVKRTDMVGAFGGSR